MSYGRPRHQLVAYARSMRKQPTRAERIIWSRLRRKQLLGQKFRRQHVLQPYIVDFYCRSARLVIELDGLTHDSPDAQRHDQRRTEHLEERYDVLVMRFTDSEVVDDPDSVLRKIAGVLENRL